MHTLLRRLSLSLGLLALSLVLIGQAPGTGRADNDPTSKYGINLRLILSRDLASQVGQPGVLDASTLSLIFSARSDVSTALRSLGLNVRSVIGQNAAYVMTADVPVRALAQAAALNDVTSVDAPEQLAPTARLSVDPSSKYGHNLRLILANDLASQVGQPGVLDASTLSLLVTAGSDVSPALRVAGATPRSVIGRDSTYLITADIPVGALANAAAIDDVRWLEAPDQYRVTIPAPPTLIVSTNQFFAPTVRRQS